MVIAEHDRPFAEILGAILEMREVDRLRRGQDPAGIFNFANAGQEYAGEAARIRMEDLPRVVDVLTGRRHDLDVGEREGLSEEIHFLYDGALDIIVVQRKREIRASTLRDLIADLANTTVHFLPVLTEDAWRKFQRMNHVKKILFKLARPHDLADQRRLPLGRVFREIEQFNGVSAKVEITVGRVRNHWLRLERVMEVVRTYRNRETEFDALSITGAIRNEDDGTESFETIDFLKGRLQFTSEVPRRGRRLDAERCRLALREAIRVNRNYLRRFRG